MTEPTGDLAELRASVDRLAGDTGALRRSIDQAREQFAEHGRRLDEQAAEVKRVEDEAAPKTALDADRAAVRRRFRIGLAVVVAVAVVLGLLTGGLLRYRANQREIGRQFARVHAGLLEGCAARNASDADLRTKNTKLRDDTAALATSMRRSPAADQLGPVIAYLDAETMAYTDYLAALPRPTDCAARYGRR